MGPGSIRNKIWLCVSVALCGYLIATLSSFYSNSNLVRELGHLRSVVFPLTHKSSELLTAFKNQSGHFEEAFSVGEPEYVDRGRELHSDMLLLFEQVLGITTESAESHAAEISQLATEYQAYYKEAVIVYPRAAESVNNDPLFAKVFELGKKQKQLLASLEGLSLSFVNDFEAQIEAVKDEATQTSFILLGMFAAVLLLASAIIQRVSTRLLISPLGKIQQMVTAFGQGEKISPPTQTASHDEIGSLANSFYQLTETLQQTTVSKNYVDNIIKNMTDCLIVLNADAKIQTVNETTVKMLGYSEQELIGTPIEDLFSEEEHFVFNNVGLDELLQKGYIRNIETQCTTKSGAKLPVLFSGSVMRDEQRNMSGVVCVIGDITELKKAEEALKGSYDFLKTVINSLNESVSIINVDNYRIESFNKVFMDNFDLSEEEITGRVCYELIRGLADPCAEPTLSCPLQETVKTKRHAVAEHTVTSPSGKTKYLEISTTPIFDDKGILTQVVHVSRDITESKKIKKKLELMAHFDDLTGLPNRTLYGDRLSQAINSAKRQKGMLAVFFMDLDNFKPINDSLGHDAGDLVLVESANRLHKCIRESDTAGRIGGDEFTLLLVNVETVENVELVAQRVLNYFNAPFIVEDTSFDVGISIGISLYPADGEDAEILMKHADLAMYNAKENGKSTYRFYTPENS